MGACGSCFNAIVLLFQCNTYSLGLHEPRVNTEAISEVGYLHSQPVQLYAHLCITHVYTFVYSMCISTSISIPIPIPISCTLPVVSSIQCVYCTLELVCMCVCGTQQGTICDQTYVHTYIRNVVECVLEHTWLCSGVLERIALTTEQNCWQLESCMCLMCCVWLINRSSLLFSMPGLGRPELQAQKEISSCEHSSLFCCMIMHSIHCSCQ